jgi:hypothetical protein
MYRVDYHSLIHDLPPDEEVLEEREHARNAGTQRTRVAPVTRLHVNIAEYRMGI